MESTIEKAYAKINLTLHIGERMGSGYHKIDSIIQEINLFDDIILKKKDFSIKFSCEPSSCNEKQNIAYKAAELMFKEYHLKDGIEIIINKNIPVAAGLGGGSADAAAVIKGIDELYGLQLKKGEMTKIAAHIGSDVPSLILGGTVHATNYGERVNNIESFPENVYFVLAEPGIPILTKDAYHALDNNRSKNQIITKDRIKEINTLFVYALEKKDIKSIVSTFYNDFDNVIQNKPILRIKEIMANMEEPLKPLNYLLSGSGSTVFAVYDNYDFAKKLVEKLKKEGFNKSFIYSPHNIETLEKIYKK